MKRLSFKIPLYYWKVHYIEIKKNDKSKDIIRNVNKLLNKIDLKITDSWKYKIEHGYIDGANSSWNSDYRTALIFFYKVTKRGRHKLSNISHEVRHLVDAMKKFHDLKGTESTAYLTGFIIKKLYKVIK